MKELHCIEKVTSHSTLQEGLDALDPRKGEGVFVVTRSPKGWFTFEYPNNLICKVGFKRIDIAGLPLGGDPFAPQTYVIDGRDHLSQIVRNEGIYNLVKAKRPTEEPTNQWAVNAVVPMRVFNHSKNQSWYPKILLLPTLGDLKATIVWLDQNCPATMKIKAGGSKHSWTQAAASNDVYIAPDLMKMMHMLDDEPDVYRNDLGDRRSNLVRFGSGSTIREANRFLWLHNKSFPTLGGFDGQTIGGVFNTGTYGSVLSRGPMADIIVTIDMVLSDGSFVRVEPQDGITDPDSLATESPDIRLIQDNDYFYAALIDMGTMGVVHSYVLEVTDAFYLKEVRTVSSIPEIKEKLRGGKIYQLFRVAGKPVDMATQPPIVSNGEDGGFNHHFMPAYYLDILINPNSDKVSIGSRYPITVDTEDASKFGFKPPGRDLIRTIERGPGFSRPVFITWFQENFRPLLVWGVKTITGIFPSYTPHLLDSVLDAIVEYEYIDRSFNVFNMGRGQSEIPALAGTFFVPLENDMYLDAIDVIQKVAKRFAAQNLYVTGPCSMRFVHATEAMLGCPKDVCGFEFLFTGWTEHAQKMVDGFDVALREKFGGDVRLHWGQLMRDPNVEQMRSMYSKYDRWLAIRDELDPKSRFLNDWQTKILR